MISRLERILYKLAYQNAPHLVPPGWSRSGDPIERVQLLARKLATYNVTVLIGELEPQLLSLKELYIQDWLRSYGQMYTLLKDALFPSFGGISAQYADNRLPAVVVFRGEAAPVITMFSGYITPYLAVRQTSKVPELELRGFMDFILTELEAGNLSRPAYLHLQQNGVGILRQMLGATVRHVSLTSFDKPVIEALQPPSIKQQSTPPPAYLPEEQERKLHYELEHLPEDDEPETPTEQMFLHDIPLTRTKQRRPPVPPLPGKKDRL